MVKFTEAITKLMVELKDGTMIIGRFDVKKYESGEMQKNNELHLLFNGISPMDAPIATAVSYNQIKRVWFGSRWHDDFDYVATIIIESIDAHEQKYMTVFMADKLGYYSKVKLVDKSRLNKNFVLPPNTALFENHEGIIFQIEISAIDQIFYRGTWWTGYALQFLLGGEK